MMRLPPPPPPPEAGPVAAEGRATAPDPDPAGPPPSPAPGRRRGWRGLGEAGPWLLLGAAALGLPYLVGLAASATCAGALYLGRARVGHWPGTGLCFGTAWGEKHVRERTGVFASSGTFRALKKKETK